MREDFYLEKRHKTKAGEKLKKFVYYARLIDEYGKVHKTISTGQSSKKRAMIFVREFIEKEKQGKLNDKSDNKRMIIKQFLLDYWDPGKKYVLDRQANKERVFSSSYLEENKRMLENHFFPWLEKQSSISLIQDFTTGDLYGFKEELSSKNLSNSRRNLILETVLSPMRYAQKRHLISLHPGSDFVNFEKYGTSKQKQRAKDRKDANILEVFEAKKLFIPEHWKGDFISRSLCLFLFGSGARIGEAQGLTFENVDFKLGLVDIVQQWSPTEGIKTPKWEKPRIGLPMSNIIMDSIYYIWENYPVGKPTLKSFCFPSIIKNGKYHPISRGTAKYRLDYALKSAGIKKQVSFHVLRHSWASHTKNVLPDELRSQILGHSDEKTTAGYTHITESQRKDLKQFQLSLLN